VTEGTLLETDRLRLHLIPAGELISLLEDPLEPSLWDAKPFVNPHRLLMDDPGPLPWRVPQVREDATRNIWFMRWIVLKESEEIIGHISFHAPPDEQGMIEIGVTIAEPVRNRGFAREALQAMWRWAIGQPGVRVLRYTVSPDNLPSIAVARSFGLHLVGRQMDEIDGPEDIYEISAEEFSRR
jgi:RimJ/RimL family protein N-acetyltransferase